VPNNTAGTGTTSVMDDCNKRVKNALTQCDTEIKWFKTRKNRDRRWYRLAQTIVIFLSALTPLLILGSGAFPGPDISKLVQAIPAAIATIVTGVNSLFDWQGNWIRYSAAETALEAEKFAFESRATEAYAYDPDSVKECDQALSNFVSTVNSILETELSEWSTRALKPPKPPPEENAG
jgi:hypothetical protein